MKICETWVSVITGYSKPKERYPVYFMKTFKSIPCNMVELYWLPVESRDEIFETCPSNTPYETHSAMKRPNAVFSKRMRSATDKSKINNGWMQGQRIAFFFRTSAKASAQNLDICFAKNFNFDHHNYFYQLNCQALMMIHQSFPCLSFP